jgi:hypothetical protein
MNDWLREIRAAAEADAGVHEIASADPQIDELLSEFFSRVPESEGFGVVLDTLAEMSTWQVAPAGKAAESARAVAAARSASDVVTVLGVPRRRARQAMEESLGLTRDAADLLLDRPAVVLLTFEPTRVRRLADVCERVPGQLFAEIVSSSRSSAGHVYAYRPGVEQGAAPARRVGEPSDAAGILEWGYRFFSLGSE